MAFRISTNPIVEIGDRMFGGDFIRQNDGSLIIRDDADDARDDMGFRLVVPRVAYVKRSDPYDKTDAEQEAFAARVVALLNGEDQ
jgi:hypothetical protein